MMDYNKPAKELLLDLIFNSNGIRFGVDDISFGVAEKLDPRPDLDWDPNSFVPVEVVETVDTRYEGATGFMYRRVPFNEVPAVVDPPPVRIPTYPFHTLDVLADINAYLGVQLEPSDVINDEYEDENTPFVVRLADGALCFTGEATITDTTFRGMVKITALSGFVEWQPTTSNLMAWLANRPQSSSIPA
jgi:hypothetical protein